MTECLNEGLAKLDAVVVVLDLTSFVAVVPVEAVFELEEEIEGEEVEMTWSRIAIRSE